MVFCNVVDACHYGGDGATVCMSSSVFLMF